MLCGDVFHKVWQEYSMIEVLQLMLFIIAFICSYAIASEMKKAFLSIKEVCYGITDFLRQ